MRYQNNRDRFMMDFIRSDPGLEIFLSQEHHQIGINQLGQRFALKSMNCGGWSQCQFFIGTNLKDKYDEQIG